MSDVEKVLAALEARREIYATKEERASEDRRPVERQMNYTRADVFEHSREAMEWAINDALQALGRPTKYPD